MTVPPQENELFPYGRRPSPSVIPRETVLTKNIGGSRKEAASVAIALARSPPLRLVTSCPNSAPRPWPRVPLTHGLSMWRCRRQSSKRHCSPSGEYRKPRAPRGWWRGVVPTLWYRARHDCTDQVNQVSGSFLCARAHNDPRHSNSGRLAKLSYQSVRFQAETGNTSARDLLTRLCNDNDLLDRSTNRPSFGHCLSDRSVAVATHDYECA